MIEHDNKVEPGFDGLIWIDYFALALGLAGCVLVYWAFS